jgi:hypothetical protein
MIDLRDPPSDITTVTSEMRHLITRITFSDDLVFDVVEE